MTVISLVEVSFEEKYQQAKQFFLNHINNDARTIILYGPGGNGKSHLTHELNDILDYHEYVIYSPTDTYLWGGLQFLANLDNPEKKILHFLFDPFLSWNIDNNTNVQVIDMSNMKW